jgi:PEP-CTERM motif
MHIRPLRSAFVLLSLHLAALTAHAATHDATADFDINGTIGDWQYGYDSATTAEYDFQAFDLFTVGPNGYGWTDSLYNTIGTPTIWYSISGYQIYGVPDGWLVLHPGPAMQTGTSDAAILRFTAPEAGHYTVTTTTLAGDLGQTESWIVLNGDMAQPWMSRGPDLGDLTTQGSLQLQAGDTLDLVVGSRDGFWFDSTPVQFTITSSVPEPGPAALLAAGLAAIAWRRRTRAA